ncbi:MAG: hypothetical protein ABEJ57_08695 [Halobacteriaceae archaeon]
MSQTNFNTIDRLVLATSGALMLIGIVGLGLIEVLDGPPYAPAVPNQAGDVVYGTFGPDIRTGIVMAGIILLGLYGIYKLATPYVGPTEEQTAEAQTH